MSWNASSIAVISLFSPKLYALECPAKMQYAVQIYKNTDKK